jgi:hypothetical protein
MLAAIKSECLAAMRWNPHVPEVYRGALEKSGLSAWSFRGAG